MPQGTGWSAAPSVAESLLTTKAALDGCLEDVDGLEEARTPLELAALTAALEAFRAAGADVLADATDHLWAYYEDTVRGLTEEQLRDYEIPTIPRDNNIWREVDFVDHSSYARVGNPPLAPAAAYVSFTGSISWDVEHGLQLVFADGVRLCKLGPFDDHETNATREDLSLLEVVYRRRRLGAGS